MSDGSLSGPLYPTILRSAGQHGHDIATDAFGFFSYNVLYSLGFAFPAEGDTTKLCRLVMTVPSGSRREGCDVLKIILRCDYFLS